MIAVKLIAPNKTAIEKEIGLIRPLVQRSSSANWTNLAELLEATVNNLGDGEARI